VSLVPILLIHSPDMQKLDEVLDKLRNEGSVAVPGWMKPEGAVVSIAPIRWKEILDKDGPSPEEG
jgi:hypothetical protein